MGKNVKAGAESDKGRRTGGVDAQARPVKAIRVRETPTAHAEGKTSNGEQPRRRTAREDVGEIAN